MSGTNQEIEGSTTVQSVTGPNVDNTDPANPVVNPLGLIQIIDLNGELFTDITTAKAYIRTFIDEINYPITNESFEKGVFYFTVPRNTVVSLDIDFMSNTSAWFVDEYGLILAFSISCFNFNSGDNLFGRPDDSISVNGTIFQGAASFKGASGTNLFISIDPQTVIGTAYFGENATGKFIFENNIGASETVSLPEFFNTSTATIFVNASKYTSNSGGINASLQTAITNGCNVQFDGINLVTLKSIQTLTNKRITQRVTTITSSATPTINTDNCDDVDITALATAITSMTINLSGAPTNFQKLIIRIKDNGTARAIAWGASYASMGGTLPTTTVLGKVTTVGLIYNTTTSIWGCVAVSQEV